MFDWNAVFGLDENPLELIARTSVLYLVLIVALRMEETHHPVKRRGTR